MLKQSVELRHPAADERVGGSIPFKSWGPSECRLLVDFAGT